MIPTFYEHMCKNRSNAIFAHIMVAGKNQEEYYCCPSQMSDDNGMLKDVECYPGNLGVCRVRTVTRTSSYDTGKKQYITQSR